MLTVLVWAAFAVADALVFAAIIRLRDQVADLSCVVRELGETCPLPGPDPTETP